MRNYTNEEKETLIWLQQKTLNTLLSYDNISKAIKNTNSYIIDDEKLDKDQDDYLNELINKDKLVELEKSNSLVYASIIIQPYNNNTLKKEEIIQMYKDFWNVIWGTMLEQEYIKKYTNNIFSIELYEKLKFGGFNN